MSWRTKVVWSEGMLLQPQHLQQSERHADHARHVLLRSTTPYAWGHGYQYTGSPKWRTIMAYACTGGCPRLNYWSNPNNLYNGHPMGTTTKNHNARVLNDTRATVAAFR